MFEAKRQPTLSEQAYNQIKDAICQGSVAPGDILSENQIAQQLGMSRTPVREALRALASEGFVEIRNGIGAYIKPLSPKDMEDLYDVRCLLAMHAIKTPIYRISNDEIDDLTRRFQAIYDACEQGDSPAQGEFSELDWELHSLLVDRCTNNYIKEIVAGNNSNLRRYRSLSVNVLGDVHESARRHLEILRVLRSRDLDKLEEVLHAHLMWSANLLRTNV